MYFLLIYLIALKFDCRQLLSSQASTKYYQPITNHRSFDWKFDMVSPRATRSFANASVFKFFLGGQRLLRKRIHTLRLESPDPHCVQAPISVNALSAGSFSGCYPWSVQSFYSITDWDFGLEAVRIFPPMPTFLFGAKDSAGDFEMALPWSRSLLLLHPLGIAPPIKPITYTYGDYS